MANEDELISCFDQMKTTISDAILKGLPSDFFFDPRDIAADNTAILR